MRTLWIVALLAACSEPDVVLPEIGQAFACLGNDAGLLPSGTETEGWEITGQVVAMGAGSGGELFPCNDAIVDHSVAIVDADGATWTLGYGLKDADGATAGPPLDLVNGADVSLTFRAVQSGEGQSAGFVLSDASGALAAVELGAWGDALEPADLPTLAISTGSERAREASECGDIVQTSIVFRGDDEVEITPVNSDIVTIDGVEHTAWAIAAWDYDQTTCPDSVGVRAWALFR
jgi:hypothetical protein